MHEGFLVIFLLLISSSTKILPVFWSCWGPLWPSLWTALANISCILKKNVICFLLVVVFYIYQVVSCLLMILSEYSMSYWDSWVRISHYYRGFFYLSFVALSAFVLYILRWSKCITFRIVTVYWWVKPFIIVTCPFLSLVMLFVIGLLCVIVT